MCVYCDFMMLVALWPKQVAEDSQSFAVRFCYELWCWPSTERAFSSVAARPVRARSRSVDDVYLCPLHANACDSCHRNCRFPVLLLLLLLSAYYPACVASIYKYTDQFASGAASSSIMCIVLNNFCTLCTAYAACCIVSCNIEVKVLCRASTLVPDSVNTCCCIDHVFFSLSLSILIA